MRRFALFVSLAVGTAAAWEISKYLQSPESKSGDLGANDPPVGGSGLSLGVDATPAPCTFCEVVNSIVEPIKDAVVTVTRSVFGTPYDALITSSANTYGIPPEVLYKLLYQESRFRPDIIEGRTKSPAGALGIAQFMPATAVEELGSVEAALDPAKAIPGAARYLAKLRSSLGGDIAKAVAAYNWGVGNVKRKGIAAAPKETQNYVQNILGVTLV
jgi:soluble lytic murein transglycosylase-like protein